MASLQDLSNELADLVERASKSVVRVDARRGRAGTGIVWDEGLVLTADHVVEHEEQIEVASNGKSTKVTIVGRDPATDLALLKAEGLSAPKASRGRIGDLKIGNLVIALGRPGELHATLGVISSLSASFRSWRGGEIERLVQTNAELLPGFSGGPLIDVQGRVVGINSWHLGRGISRAIPMDTAERVTESLRTHGRIRRAYLGVGTQPVPLAEPIKSQVKQSSGLLVVTVEADGPAAKAGLLQGDTVVGLNGNPIKHLDDLFRALRGLEVGSAHTLRVIRAGQLQDLKVTVGERAA
jgi:S1-C subfamily serine protease